MLSYLYPITIHKETSEISKTLEITFVNGKLVLDSKQTNYSYGSLQKILRKGLRFIGVDEILKMNHILVLGVAGGSVIDTLVNEFKYKGQISGVEMDQQVLDLGRKYFGLEKYTTLDLYHDEAFEFVLKTKLKYDLIIIDIFQDTYMPGFLFENFFQHRLTEIMQPNGYILFNTMLLSKTDETRNVFYVDSWKRKNVEVKLLPRLEHHNEVIIIKNTSS
ncbi:MAG: spermidine synthase [Flavobacterium sp.]